MDAIKQPKSLAEQTYDILLNAISSGDFEPGKRLNQDELAARLNVSRQPVNSAISVLKANGFVEDTGRRGVIVTQISLDQFLSLYEFRTAIDPFAVRLAHSRKPRDAHTQAQEMIKRGWSAVKSQDPKTQIEIDFEFHKMIYDWAGNTTISDTMRLHWHHIRRAMGVVLRQGVPSQTSWEEHEKVIEALMAGLVERAEDEMRRHVANAQAKTSAVLSQV
jgi:DNA-binding GntR family transcriptional regulator